MTEEERVRWRSYLQDFQAAINDNGEVDHIDFETLFFNPFEHTADFLPGQETMSPYHNMMLDLEHMVEYLLKQLER